MEVKCRVTMGNDRNIYKCYDRFCASNGGFVSTRQATYIYPPVRVRNYRSSNHFTAFASKGEISGKKVGGAN